MNGIWLDNNRLHFKTTLNKPTPSDNEALVKVRMAGICGTDLQLQQGYYAYSGIPGHEFVGEVVECVDNPGLIHQRVVGQINIGCGVCDFCLANNGNHCKSRKVLGIKDHPGAFAEYVVLPHKNLHIVDADISDKQAVFVEPIAAACRILQQINIDSNQNVLVIGAGRLGLIIAQVLATRHSHIDVLIRRQIQFSFVQSLNINAMTKNEISHHTYDVVVEASGSTSGLELAFTAIKPQGVIVVKSTYHQQPKINLSKLVVDEITLLGSRCGPFDVALDLLREKQVNPLPLITAVHKLEDVNVAFAQAAAPGGLKVLFEGNYSPPILKP